MLKYSLIAILALSGVFPAHAQKKSAQKLLPARDTVNIQRGTPHVNPKGVLKMQESDAPTDMAPSTMLPSEHLPVRADDAPSPAATTGTRR